MADFSPSPEEHPPERRRDIIHLIRSNDELRERNDQMQQEILDLRRQLEGALSGRRADRDSRLAAVNLMEDAVRAHVETERTRQALTESEQRFRSLVESYAQAVWETNAAGEVVLDSPSWRAYTGQTSAERAGLGWLNAIHPDDRTEAEKQWREAVSSRRLVDAEFRLKYARDGYRWTNVRATPILAPDGTVLKWSGMNIDVHDRKLAEEALRESEAHMAAFFSRAEVGISEISSDGRFLRVNETLCRILGRSREELLQLGPANITHPDDLSRTIEAMGKLLENGDPLSIDKRYIRNDGVIIWANSALSRLHNANRPPSVLAVTTDLTARRRAEEALRESEARFRTLADAVPQVIWGNDSTGSASYFNRRWFEYSGLSLEESRGPGWQRIVHPDDADSSVKRWHTALETGETFETEYRLRRFDGSYRWHIGRNVPVKDETGRVIEWFGTATDIHDLKMAEAAYAAAEERLRLVLESVQEYAIFSMDLERRVTSWNRGAERILGFSEAEIFGKLGDVIFTPEDRASGGPESEQRECLLHGRASDERWHLRKDGTRFWGSGVMMAMHDQKGDIVGLVKIFRDETKARESREQLEESRAELLIALQENEQARAEVEAASHAKDHFLAVLSHELRTPLQPVMMSTLSLLERSDLPPPVTRGLNIIQRNVEMECRLIDELLDLTRIARGRLEIQHDEIDVHDVIHQAIEVCRPDIEKKQQVFTFQPEAGKSVLNGDFDRLQQTVWNLLKNASKFTPPGGPIHLATYNETDHIIVCVADGGAGIAPEKLSMIFDAFTQADESVSREFGGLGLGLAIAKATVEAHGGNIWAESKGSGLGASFFLKLPLKGPTS